MSLAVGRRYDAAGEIVPNGEDPFGDWNRGTASAEIKHWERCIASAEQTGANPFLYRERLKRFGAGENGVEIKIITQTTVFGA